MDYTTEQLNVYNTIKVDGASIVIKYSTMGTYNPTSDTMSTSSVNYSTYGILTDCTKRDWGDQIFQGEKAVLVPAYNLPRLDQLGQTKSFTISIGLRKLVPNLVKVVEPGGVALLYKIKVTG